MGKSTIKKSKIRKSNKFPGAYTIPGYNGHYFLNDAKETENGFSVPYVFYRCRWYEDSRTFPPEYYREIMQSL